MIPGMAGMEFIPGQVWRTVLLVLEAGLGLGLATMSNTYV